MTVPQIRALPSELLQISKQELNEVPERLAQDLADLKQWLARQPHLKARTDDQFLVAFLRGCKFSLEKTKTKLDRFYALRSKFPEAFGFNESDLDFFLKFIKLGSVVYFPMPLHGNGARIGLVKLSNLDISQYNIVDLVHMALLIHEIMLIEDDYACVHGLTHLLDMQNCSTGHFLQMTPPVLKKMAAWLEKAMPLRVKDMHYINTPRAFDPVFNIFKPMLSSKLQERLHLHGSNMEELYKHIPQKYLPKEYGGENGSIEESIAEWTKRIESYREYYREEAQYGTDEKLRVGKPIDFQSMFGIEGSFRKLEVD